MARRILIARLSSLGDVICGLPVAVALHEAFPGDEISWAVDPRFAGIPLCCTAIDHTILVRKPTDVDPFRPFDVAIDLQGLLKSALVVARSGASVKVGYHWQREGARLFSRPVLPDPTSIHIVDQYVDVARALGATMHTARFGLKPLAEDLDDMRRLLAEQQIDATRVEGRFVVLNAGAGWASKRWPPASFAEVALGLRERGLHAVFIGAGEADRAAFREVAAAGALDAVSLLGKTTVRELVALLTLAHAHIGGDTGSSHLAAALGVPAIGLYSITRPERSCPYGQIDRCLYSPHALSDIAPAEVLALVDRLEG
ncbi:MAG TPA: glycosyltransferase family 9 protein [Fimbriimonadaceae bacterium]|nr:glycosyltransferase family 9 protein [Fimbriimonadaceae bacterium]HRJ97399.1 glycosyltransferase family 9 protein [Fimbriimonadaceae bacterium]